MMQRIVFLSLVSLFFSPLGVGAVYADSAEVLPKGISRLSVDSNFYSTITERFNPDGDEEPLASDYNTTLDSSVFPALAAAELPQLPVFGVPAGTASVGNSVVSFEYEITTVEMSYQYGLTDRATLGIKIPYWEFKNNVSRRLDTTNANVGKNVAGNTLAPLRNPVLDGILGGPTVPLTTQDVIDLVGDGLDINGDGSVDVQGFGFEDFADWDTKGLADIEVGFRYQYLKTEDWRLAFTGGVRFPTGEVDDPDSLVDYGLGDGAWALLFRLNNDYMGIKNLVLNVSFAYDLVFPEHERLRVPSDVNQPITTNEEEVDRDLGDVVQFEGSAAYQFLEGFNFSVLYQYRFKLEDHVEGSQGFDYSQLEAETKAKQHVGKVGLSYSTVPRYMKKSFPVPLVASISYRWKFGGENNALDSEYIGFGLSVYF